MTWVARLGRLFPVNSLAETVRTSIHFDATAEEVWQAMLFYEEVPRRPAPVLRLFLPAPIRTEGDKARVGAAIRCTYEGGYLEKRIIEAAPPHLLRFEVTVQALGIEDAILMEGGFYQIDSDRDGVGCNLVLATRYCGHLRPRWLWRPLERFLAHRLHRHILWGMRVLLEQQGKTPAAPHRGASSVWPDDAAPRAGRAENSSWPQSAAPRGRRRRRSSNPMSGNRSAAGARIWPATH